MKCNEMQQFNSKQHSFQAAVIENLFQIHVEFGKFTEEMRVASAGQEREGEVMDQRLGR